MKAFYHYPGVGVPKISWVSCELANLHDLGGSSYSCCLAPGPRVSRSETSGMYIVSWGYSSPIKDMVWLGERRG